jgi:hypothetical protein
MGRVKLKVLPWPGFEATSMLPQWSSIMNLAMYNPMPKLSALPGASAVR